MLVLLYLIILLYVLYTVTNETAPVHRGIIMLTPEPHHLYEPPVKLIMSKSGRNFVTM